MDNTTYEIEAFRSENDSRLDELSQALNTELTNLGLHRTVNVAPLEFEPSVEAPSIGVYFASPEAQIDATLTDRVARALAAGRVVIPVVDDLSAFYASVPEVLHPLNGHEWSGTEADVRLARFLLEELGIEESERRVFISHRRSDGLGAAEQLRDQLSRVRFEPFIDRFNIRSGEDVQRKIAEALENHAFMLVLETPLAAASEWVFDEVEYALSHTMGIVIVRWPGDHDEIPGSSRVPRLSLQEEDLRADEHGYEVLTDGALDRVLAEAEAAHAQGLVRRRKMLIRSIEEAAVAAGCTSLPLPDWRVMVECQAGGESTLLGITPRLPSANDLQFLDQAREEVAVGALAVLVHAARSLRGDLRSHLQWVAGERELVVMPENAIGSRWTRD